MKDRTALRERLERAESEVALFLNKRKEPIWVNRLRKFLRQPLKFVYLNAMKAGVPLPETKKTSLFFGESLLLPLRDENAVVLYYTGTLDLPECAVMKYLIANLDEGDTFYDVGTHFGVYSMLARALVGSSGEVHSFEPNPHSAELLRENGIPFTEAAVSDAEGSMDFFDTSGRKSATSSALPEAVLHAGVPYTVERVNTITLDDYVREHRPPTLMKIDVEGWEHKVLLGAGELLSSSRPTIIMEIWDEPHVIERTMSAVNRLRELGYSAYRILPDGSLHREDPVPGAIGQFENFCFRPA